jgi:hypothetical protein
MMELAEVLNHVADYPTHVAASRIELARVSVQRKLIALSVLHKELRTA